LDFGFGAGVGRELDDVEVVEDEVGVPELLAIGAG